MKIEPLPQEPLLRYGSGHGVPHVAWQTAALATALAGLFVLLLRFLGA